MIQIKQFIGARIKLNFLSFIRFNFELFNLYSSSIYIEALNVFKLVPYIKQETIVIRVQLLQDRFTFREQLGLSAVIHQAVRTEPGPRRSPVAEWTLKASRWPQ